MPPETSPTLRLTLDAVDLRLLDLLQTDASLTNHALAEAAHVSPATALRRVRRLTESGVIARTVALAGPPFADAGLTVISEISLDAQGAERLDAFEVRAVADPAVKQCYRVSPGPDFVLIAHAADMPAWAAVVQRLFTQDANVRNVKSYFSVRRAKFETAVQITGRDLDGVPGGVSGRAAAPVTRGAEPRVNAMLPRSSP